MKPMDQTAKAAHSAKHWQGKCWGEGGSVCGGLFALLSTLYAAVKSAPTLTRRLLVLCGIVQIYVVVRTCYELEHLSAGQLDVLASVGRNLKQHRHAILCATLALGKSPNFSDSMLLLAGLMRDYDAMCPADQPGSKSHYCFFTLRASHEEEEYDPPEQKIRVKRALAWFANKYPAREHCDAKQYARDALALANQLGASDQADAVKKEFGHLLAM